MVGTNAPLRTRVPGCTKPPSVQEQIIARWSGSGLLRRGARIAVAVDVGGNQLILTGTVRTPTDREQAVVLAAVDSLRMLIIDRIRAPRADRCDQAR